MMYNEFLNEVKASDIGTDAVTLINHLFDNNLKFFNYEIVEEVVGEDKALTIIAYLREIYAITFMKSYGFYMHQITK